MVSKILTEQVDRMISAFKVLPFSLVLFNYSLHMKVHSYKQSTSYLWDGKQAFSD